MFQMTGESPWESTSNRLYGLHLVRGTQTAGPALSAVDSPVITLEAYGGAE